jgi:ribosomal protein S18 acetylase RimI-like enzyme
MPRLADLFVQYLAFYGIARSLNEAEDYLLARMEQAQSVILVAEADGTLAAFVQLYPGWSSTRMAPLWILNDLYVAPAQRGTGLGRALVQAAQQHCVHTGAIELTLETAVDNVQGNALYQAEGFYPVAGVNFYRWNPPALGSK